MFSNDFAMVLVPVDLFADCVAGRTADDGANWASYHGACDCSADKTGCLIVRC